ncbi:hypothetical protein LCGC14_1102040 [marine sediment metagenome]|uniref:Uncharacterized protein n=2 Tax=root TaxID=1 RepID=A0A9C9NDB5_9HYPH|nr:hypothetical protein [Aurantimonas coralicida]
MSGAFLSGADLTSALDDYVDAHGYFPEYVSLSQEANEAVMASTFIGQHFGVGNVFLNIWNGVPVRVDEGQIEAMRIVGEMGI